MAEKSTDLTKVDDLDPVSNAAGADSKDALEGFDRSYELGSEKTGEETDHIKAQIAQTRSQMGETIDAIQDRLSFANISEQVSETVNSAIETAKDTAYDATIGKAAMKDVVKLR
jgi:methyl-accepting chemotaxis protein